MRKTLLRLTLVIMVVSVLVGLCLAGGDHYDIAFYEAPDQKKPLPIIINGDIKNVILFIADGMGPAQVDAARIGALGADGRLHFETMPIVGFSKTHSETNLVTDSAAAGTALASGMKTYNGGICQDKKERKFATILEMAEKKGMSTGLVATSAITHATPASFASHVESRKMEDKIAEQIIENDVDVILGGGRKFFIPEEEDDSGRKDDMDLLKIARKKGWEIIENREELKSVKGDKILGLFQMEALTTEDAEEPSIAEMTRKAIEILSRDEDGFFLMVEGSQIDWKCHGNDAEGAIRQTLLFDMAVKEGLDFAQKDGNTLVLVTADHECGGMTINEGELNGDDLELEWTTRHHSGIQVPVYAYGPGALRFTGVMDNTQIPQRMSELLKTVPLPHILD
mgnify:CR=1 FL=1